jgi:hypothetical protein
LGAQCHAMCTWRRRRRRRGQDNDLRLQIMRKWVVRHMSIAFLTCMLICNDATNLDYLWDAVGRADGRGNSCHQMQRCAFQTLSLLLGCGKQSAPVYWQLNDSRWMLMISSFKSERWRLCICLWGSSVMGMYGKCRKKLERSSWYYCSLGGMIITGAVVSWQCLVFRACYIAQVFAKDVVGYLVDCRTVKKV